MKATFNSKKLPCRTYIKAEESKLHGHKPIKDRLTPVFSANDSMDFEDKSLLAYHSKNPHAFKAQNISKINYQYFKAYLLSR